MVIHIASSHIPPPSTDRGAEARIAADDVDVRPQRSWFFRHWVLMVALAVILFVGMVTAATLAGKSASDSRMVGADASPRVAAASPHVITDRSVDVELLTSN